MSADVTQEQVEKAQWAYDNALIEYKRSRSKRTAYNSRSWRRRWPIPIALDTHRKSR